MKLPDLKLEKEKNIIRITTPYWEVIQSKESGWCVNSIIITNGRNRNILTDALYSSFASFENCVVDFPEYSDKFDKNALIEVKYNTSEKIVLEATGTLKNKTGQGINVDFCYQYKYLNCGSLTITRAFNVKSVSNINQILIGSLSLNGNLTEFGIKESYDDHLATPYKTWTKKFGINFIKWHKIDKKVQVNHSAYSIPGYFSFFERNCEGLDVFPGSNMYEWWVYNNNEALGRYTSLNYDAYNDSISLKMYPLFEAMGREPASLTGEFTFTTVMGLPFKEKKKGSKIFHVGINSQNWPSDEKLKEWGDTGIQLLRLHDDGYKPEGFWKDGSYPPYNKANMQEMDRVIKSAHKNGIKIIPYFSITELHKDTKEFKENWKEWRRIFKGSEDILFSQLGGKGFGGLMCLQSGWADFFKASVKRVLNKHDFDGVYYDWCYGSLVCEHKGHAKGRHNMTEEIIELVHWTRKFLGKDKLIVAHQSPSSLIPLENVADYIITLEELSGDDYFLNTLPHPTQFPPHCSFIGLRQRFICAGIGKHKLPNGKSIPGYYEAFLIRCFLADLVAYASFGGNSSQVPEMFCNVAKIYSSIDFSRYVFYDIESTPVITDKAAVLSVLYHGQEDSLLLLGNLSNKDVNYNLKLKADAKNIFNENKLIIKPLLPKAAEETVTIDSLFNGKNNNIKGNDLKIYLIKNGNSKREY